MPRVSKRKIVQKEIAPELENNFIYLISFLSSPQQISNFFKEFLTDEEQLMLSKRIMLHLMLEEKYPQVDISRALGMSRETVRIHNAARLKAGVKYKQVMDKLRSRRKMKDIWKQLEKKLRPFELIIESRNNMRSRAKLAQGDFD